MLPNSKELKYILPIIKIPPEIHTAHVSIAKNAVSNSGITDTEATKFGVFWFEELFADFLDVMFVMRDTEQKHAQTDKNTGQKTKFLNGKLWGEMSGVYRREKREIILKFLIAITTDKKTTVYAIENLCREMFNISTESTFIYNRIKLTHPITGRREEELQPNETEKKQAELLNVLFKRKQYKPVFADNVEITSLTPKEIRSKPWVKAKKG